MPSDAAPRPIHIAPSVLPADFSKMGDELKALLTRACTTQAGEPVQFP